MLLSLKMCIFNLMYKLYIFFKKHLRWVTKFLYILWKLCTFLENIQLCSFFKNCVHWIKLCTFLENTQLYLFFENCVHWGCICFSVKYFLGVKYFLMFGCILKNTIENTFFLLITHIFSAFKQIYNIISQ